MNEPHRYLTETRRPIYSALLLTPFLLIYHAGTALFQSDVINACDAVIQRNFLVARISDFFGLNASFASLLVLLVCFVIWEQRVKGGWRAERGLTVLLAFESLAFAALLFLLMHFAVAPAFSQILLPAAAGSVSEGARAIDFVLYCGAGVYEELVFRVFLLGLLTLTFVRLFHMEKSYAAAWAVICGAALFSLFHYVGALGDAWSWNSFFQRFFAGIFFAALYVLRGFGVAAAAHSLYDVIVGLWRL
jgi:membrane protease YdiL (CAAX protease family)